MVRAQALFAKLVGAALLGGCMSAPELNPPRENCGGDDPRIGRTAALTTRAHGVSGTARILDNCTILIENFNYDGGGLDVRVYGGDAAGRFFGGAVLSEDLTRAGGYVDETLRVTLPQGVTLDDAESISIWCVDAAVSFGDGVFE